MDIKIIATIMCIISCIFFINTPIKNYGINICYYKAILINVVNIFVIGSLYIDNIYINNYIVPILIFLNILILIPITLYSNNDLFNIVFIGCFLYLLCSYSIKSFAINKGLIKNPDKKWIYIHCIILVLWYYFYPNKEILSNESVLILICLVLFPLLFPIKNYVLYRIITLALVISIRWYKIRI